MLISQTNRLLSIQIHGLVIPVYITSLTGVEKIASSFSYSADITVQDNTQAETLINTSATIKITRGEQTQYIHGYITAIKQMTQHNNAQNFQIRLQPFLYYLQHHYYSIYYTLSIFVK